MEDNNQQAVKVSAEEFEQAVNDVLQKEFGDNVLTQMNIDLCKKYARIGFEFSSSLCKEKDEELTALKQKLEDETIDCEFQSEMRSKAEQALKESGELCKQYQEEKESIQAHRNDLSEELSKLREENNQMSDKWAKDVMALSHLREKADKLAEALQRVDNHLKEFYPNDDPTVQMSIFLIQPALNAYNQSK